MEKFQFLKKPWFILLAAILGVILGINYPPFSLKLKKIGNIYIDILKMSVIPILISAIIFSFGNLVKSSKASSYIVRIFSAFMISVILVSSIGIAVAVVGRPGAGLDEKARDLGIYISNSTDSADMVIPMHSKVRDVKKKNLSDFIFEIVPNNIFRSLNSGRTLQILFFSILLGLAIGLVKNDDSTHTLKMFQVLFIAFQKIISWAMYVLPFALVCILAGQIASVGTSIFSIMIKFLNIFYIGGLIIFLINLLIISLRSKKRILEVLKAIQEATIVPLATSNSFASLPPSIDALSDKLSFERDAVNLATPIGLTLGRYGNIMYFAMASVFVCQLYNFRLGINEIFIIFVGSILAGLATTGASGLATLSMISLILGPLGLPSETIFVILMAVDPIIDPMRTLLIVNTNIAATSLVAKRYDKRAENGC